MIIFSYMLSYAASPWAQLAYDTFSKRPGSAILQLTLIAIFDWGAKGLITAIGKGRYAGMIDTVSLLTALVIVLDLARLALLNLFKFAGLA